MDALLGVEMQNINIIVVVVTINYYNNILYHSGF